MTECLILKPAGKKNSIVQDTSDELPHTHEYTFKG